MLRVGFAIAASAALAGVLGCSSSSDETPGKGDGGAQATGGAPGEDARAARDPVSVWEPELPTEGEYCSFLAAVECDGSEDCPDGQICCGTINGGSLSYDSVRCQDRCELAEGGREMCHPGYVCPNPEQECIRSIILPAYLAVCSTANAFTPEGIEGTSSAPAEINCGPGLACTGGDVCCARTSWNAETQKAEFIDGRCAATADECSCSAGKEPDAVVPLDGGAAGADSGAADAGSEAGGG
jgi:hypothetical protein